MGPHGINCVKLCRDRMGLHGTVRGRMKLHGYEIVWDRMEPFADRMELDGTVWEQTRPNGAA